VSIFSITVIRTNKDIPANMNLGQAKQHYLDLYGADFEPKMPPPVIEAFEDKMVLRADLAPAGLKAYGAEKLIAETKEDVLVYCAPRVGHAPDAIATLAKMYGKRCVFFCPASARVSNHQAVLKAHGADLRFIRIAAMPVLNGYAKQWAEKHGAKFLPFGLSGVPQVTAGLVRLADHITQHHGEPTEVWMAVSTGTAIRAFQIGWPHARAHGVAVARNMHDGEIGNAKIRSATMQFLSGVKKHLMPSFPTTATYDAKAWDDFVQLGSPGAIFINVGSDQAIESMLGQVDVDSIDSAREWGDLRDLERGL